MLYDWESFQFELNDDGTAAVAKYRGGDTMPAIPSRIEGRTVTAINDWAFGRFFGQRPLLGVQIPDTVTSIGAYAFSKCAKLSNINIPSSITFIGAAAFSGCASLLFITLPPYINEINDWLFKDCRQLREIRVPYDVSQIGKGAFSGCRSLEEIFLPDDVSVIEFETFRDCRSLVKLDLPPSVTRIGDGAFKGCRSLAHLTIPHRVSYIGADAFHGGTILHAYEDSYTKAYAKMKNLPFIPIEGPVQQEEFPGDVIAERAFAGDAEMTVAIIPEGILSVGNGAYANCSALTRVELPESLTVIGIDAFTGTAVTEIIIPASVVKIGWNAFPPGTILHGEKNGYAQSYAEKNKYFFEPIGIENVPVNKSMLDVLNVIYKTRGADAFADGRLFKNLLSDLLPGDGKNTGIRNVLNAAVTQLNAASAVKQEDAAAKERFAKALMDFGYQPRLAREAAFCFWKVLCYSE